MSNAINIMRDQRKAQVELSPSSEDFQIVGGVIFRGIFDRSHEEDNKDDGNIQQKKLVPRIMVSVVPSGIVPRITKVIRSVDNTTYTVRFVSIDDEGIPVIWLY